MVNKIAHDALRGVLFQRRVHFQWMHREGGGFTLCHYGCSGKSYAMPWMWRGSEKWPQSFVCGRLMPVTSIRFWIKSEGVCVCASVCVCERERDGHICFFL